MKSSANLSYESWNWSPGKWSSIRPLGGGCPCCGGKPHRWPNNSGKYRNVKLQLGILRSFSTPVWTLVKHFRDCLSSQVGSSLGGWLSLVAASQLSDRLHGLVLVAPALNYVWPYYHRWHYSQNLHDIKFDNLQIQGHPGSRSKSSSGRWRSTCNHYSSNGWCAP